MKRKTCLNTPGMPILGSFVLTAFLLLAATGCAPVEDENGGTSDSTFSSVPLPNPHIDGYSFPEPEATILGWVSNHDSSEINLHAWGIWTALTQETNQMYEGQSLRVFETWFTPADIIADSAARNPRPLGPLSQLVPNPSTTVEGFVKYDPVATAFTEQNDYLSKATLNGLIAAGDSAIKNFPSPSVTLKPVFLPGFIDQLKLIQGRYYMLPVWPGPPDPAKQSLPKDWPDCVWVDTQDQTDGTGTALDSTCDATGTTSRTAATTYGLGRFIHFVEDGKTQILTAMHVTSRETTRWTWQTFWWTPTPEKPHPPSSASIAADRPPQLKGAPSNYAHCTAYSMRDPQQPNTGGSNTGRDVFCYNPWLEAGFGPETLVWPTPQATNHFGVQTNCMSCHAQARYPTNTPGGVNPFYTGDRYIDIGPLLRDTLRLDFAWSILVNAK